MQKNIVTFPSIEPFSFAISHVDEVTRDRSTSHIHDQCEIYVNVSGNVSFMVEGQLYPIQRGSVIITRPFEYHHCIYHDFSPHEHFWILFSCRGNEPLLELFFNRTAGKENLITLPEEQTEQLLDLCRTMAETKNPSPLTEYRNFFTLLSLLNEGGQKEKIGKNLPPELHHALHIVNSSFSASLRVEALAQESFISVNTLERMFKKHLGLTPTEYIRQKRLSHGAKLLQQGYNVSGTAAECGFSDVSQFIILFKKEFGQTPLQYKKQNEQMRES